LFELQTLKLLLAEAAIPHGCTTVVKHEMPDTAVSYSSCLPRIECQAATRDEFCSSGQRIDID